MPNPGSSLIEDLFSWLLRGVIYVHLKLQFITLCLPGVKALMVSWVND
jgi:hypothetical protein